MSEIATTDVNINPAEYAAQHVDALIDTLVSNSLDGLDDEFKRVARRREISWAVRAIRGTKTELDRVVADATDGVGGDIAQIYIDGARQDLVVAFSAVNRAAAQEQVEAVVDKILGEARTALANKLLESGYGIKADDAGKAKRRAKSAAS